jgi:hypothetical protein
VRIVLEDGPFDGETFDVSRETFEFGIVRVPERVPVLLVSDVTEIEPTIRDTPRIGQYVRRKYGSRLHGWRYRWMWDGWERR